MHLFAYMYDVDAIEATHFEQLATMADRLLLRRRRVRKASGATSRGEPGPAAPGLHPHVTQAVTVRSGSTSHWQVFAITVALPILVALAIGFATLR